MFVVMENLTSYAERDLHRFIPFHPAVNQRILEFRQADIAEVTQSAGLLVNTVQYVYTHEPSHLLSNKLALTSNFSTALFGHFTFL